MQPIAVTAAGRCSAIIVSVDDRDHLTYEAISLHGLAHLLRHTINSSDISFFIGLSLGFLNLAMLGVNLMNLLPRLQELDVDDALDFVSELLLSSRAAVRSVSRRSTWFVFLMSLVACCPGSRLESRRVGLVGA